MEILDSDYIAYDEFLEHHGVSGQKWGVTHGPPYPLDKNAARQARKAEKAERKAERKAKKNAKKQNRRTVSYEDLTDKQKKYVDSKNKRGMSWGRYNPAEIDKKIQQERSERLKKARQVRAKNQAAKKKAAEKEAKDKEKLQKKKEKVLKGSPEKVYRNRGLFTKDDIQSTLDRFDWEQKLQQYSSNRLKTAADKAASITRLMSSGVTGYNTVANAYNAWFPDETQLPTINLGTVQKKDDKKK